MIKSYKELEVYNKSYELVKEMLEMSKKYPKQERYEIVSQIRRAVMSIPLNIAEGYGRKQSTADFKRFLVMAAGSVNEIEVLLDISRDIGYISEDEHKDMYDRYQVLGRQINKLIQRWESN